MALMDSFFTKQSSSKHFESNLWTAPNSKRSIAVYAYTFWNTSFFYFRSSATVVLELGSRVLRYFGK